MKRKIVSTDPEVMGGTPCFAGTRVPVQTLIDYLEVGDSMDDLLEGFPTVKREQLAALGKSRTLQAAKTLSSFTDCGPSRP